MKQEKAFTVLIVDAKALETRLRAYLNTSITQKIIEQIRKDPQTREEDISKLSETVNSLSVTIGDLDSSIAFDPLKVDEILEEANEKLDNIMESLESVRFEDLDTIEKILEELQNDSMRILHMDKISKFNHTSLVPTDTSRKLRKLREVASEDIGRIA